MAKPMIYPPDTKVTVFETSDGQHPEGVRGVIANNSVRTAPGVPCQRVWLEEPSRVEWIAVDKIEKSDAPASE